MPYITSWERLAQKEGEKRGVKKEKIETARRLLKRGLGIDLITDATGLAKKEIEALVEVNR